MRFVLLIARTVHGTLYRLSGGRIGARVAGLPVLLLTTTGRKTGRRRTAPLGYLEVGDALLLVASHAGLPHHPAWYLNLETNPDVEVQMGREHRRLRARRATAAEAGRLWPQVLAVAPGYGKYRARTTREIPLVLLERP